MGGARITVMTTFPGVHAGPVRAAGMGFWCVRTHGLSTCTCGFELSGLDLGHGGISFHSALRRKLSPQVGPLAIGWDIEPVCQRILRQGPGTKEELADYIPRDFRRDLGKAR